MSILTFDLKELSTGMPGLTPAMGTMFAEAAAICMEHVGHNSGVQLTAKGDLHCELLVDWPPVTEQQRRCQNDLQDATEFGACGLAILIVRSQTGQVVVERSRKGTGFDFWLGDESEPLFQNKARLEVSGILHGGGFQVDSRVKVKQSQMMPSDGRLPGYVAVIEFSQPSAHLVRHE